MDEDEERELTRCVFVTRKFPPRIGGMETLAAATAKALEGPFDLRVIALGRSQAHLAWWLPRTALTLRRLLARGDADFVVFGDALVYCALEPLLRSTLTEHAVMVMGLDLTYRRRFYQRRLRRALPHAPLVLAISAATGREALARGVPPNRLHVVPPGVLTEPATGARPADAGLRLKEELGLAVGSTVLLTLGRLVRRKGVRWFVSEVMPRLPTDAVYLVAGTGPERDAISAAIDAVGEAGTRVRLLGQVDDRLRELLYRGSDIFVMPNVAVPGDMEGFGLVAIEAAGNGVVVVAAALEGINDAVIDGETGFLVPPGDAAAFAARVTTLVTDRSERERIGERFASVARETFSVERMQTDLVALISSARRR